MTLFIGWLLLISAVTLVELVPLAGGCSLIDPSTNACENINAKHLPMMSHGNITLWLKHYFCQPPPLTYTYPFLYHHKYILTTGRAVCHWQAQKNNQPGTNKHQDVLRGHSYAVISLVGAQRWLYEDLGAGCAEGSTVCFPGLLGLFLGRCYHCPWLKTNPDSHDAKVAS